MWRFERQAGSAAGVIAGVDEVGRGCLAGPVVTAAVVLGEYRPEWEGIADSKLLGPRRREYWDDTIRTLACGVALGWADAAEVDHWNVLTASRMAMARALENLSCPFDMAVVDGPYPPLFGASSWPSVPVVDGDARCLSIAAASIIAKVARDQWMADADQAYPGYGFARNVGYGTPEHLAALAALGPTPLHRRTFAPVQSLLV